MTILAATLIAFLTITVWMYISGKEMDGEKQ
jgi:hypothetical protein